MDPIYCWWGFQELFVFQAGLVLPKLRILVGVKFVLIVFK